MKIKFPAPWGRLKNKKNPLRGKEGGGFMIGKFYTNKNIGSKLLKKHFKANSFFAFLGGCLFTKKLMT